MLKINIHPRGVKKLFDDIDNNKATGRDPIPTRVLKESSSFPHLFPLLCGVDVSYETLPSSPVLCVLPGQFSLRQAVHDTIQPPPIWSSSPSIPRHLHPHHSLAYIFVLSSHYAHTTSTFFPALSCIFLPPSLSI